MREPAGAVVTGGEIDYHRVATPTDRSIGHLFAIVCALLALWFSRFWSQPVVDAWVLGFGTAALILLLVARFRPTLLGPLNRAWMALGGLLGRIVSPIVLGILFVALIMPFGIMRRLFIKPAIHKRPDAKAATYWTLRDPPGPKPETLNRPF